MSARGALYGLLFVVATAAAVLSFAALRDLAALCGFTRGLAPLLPIVVDAGAAAGSLVWLGAWAAQPARRFARALALILLASSVAANALSHGLAAYGARPHWTVVVLVSGVAPAVLGAVVHLAVLAARPGEAHPCRSQCGSCTRSTTTPGWTWPAGTTSPLSPAGAAGGLVGRRTTRGRGGRPGPGARPGCRADRGGRRAPPVGP